MGLFRARKPSIRESAISFTRHEGNTPPEKGRWQEVASELGVTREALYRELARRRA